MKVNLLENIIKIGSIGDIIDVTDKNLTVKLRTSTAFTASEQLTFSLDTSFNNLITVSGTGTSEVLPQLPNVVSPPTFVTSRSPDTLANTYENKNSMPIPIIKRRAQF